MMKSKNSGKKMKQGGKLRLIITAITATVIVLGILFVRDIYLENEETHNNAAKVEATNSNTNIASPAETPSEEPTEEPTSVQTILYYYNGIQAALEEDLPFVINDNSIEYFNKHSNLFPAEKEIMKTNTKLIDKEIEYKKVVKNPDEYGDKLMLVSDAKVIEIFDLVDQGITTLKVEDSQGQLYFVLFIGKLSGIVNNDTVSLIGLPLDQSSFDGMTNVVVIAGSYVSKDMSEIITNED